MSSTLTVDDIANRLTNFPHDRYLYIGGFMRSVAWAAGTIVLLRILRSDKKYWPRLLPWVGSFLATMVTLMTWGRGILLTNSSANVWDSVFPTLMGIVEFCLFAVLAPPQGPEFREEEPYHLRVDPWPSFIRSILQRLRLIADYCSRKARLVAGYLKRETSGLIPQFLKIFAKRFLKPIAADLWAIKKSIRPNLNVWHSWFFVLATHTFLAVALVNNRMSKTDIEEDFKLCLHKLGAKYFDWMREDRRGAGISTIGFILLGIVSLFVINGFKLADKSHVTLRSRLGRSRKTWVLLFIFIYLVPIGLFSFVISEAERQRQETEIDTFRIKNTVPDPCNENPSPTPTPAPASKTNARPRGVGKKR